MRDTHLSQDLHEDGHHAVVLGEALVGHVAGCAGCADEYVAAGRLKRHVLHVGPHPAVGLAEHGLRPHGGGHQEDVLALQATVERHRFIGSQFSSVFMSLLQTTK